MPPQIVWFRNDLRLSDHAALRAAAAAGPVVAVYVHDDATPGDWRIGGAQRWWLHHSLAALGEALEARGGHLVRRAGRPAEVLAEIAAAAGATAVHALNHYEPWAKAQADAVGERVDLILHDGVYLAPPGMVTGGSGQPYRIFTPFWNALHRTMPPAGPDPVPHLDFAASPRGDDDLNLLPTRDWAAGFDVWTPGEAAAKAALTAFAAKLGDYDHGRNLPSDDLTSRLSPHLHMGEISPAAVWHALAGQGATALPYLREIGWRDFCGTVIDRFPDVGDTPGRAAFADFPFRHAPADLKAWQQGRTGYPIVDAGMRQLWHIGWMHNRVRMITASFLTKHLLIDWRAGERWFWDCLVDADYGNNSQNWQWVMGSGVDSSPFGRIFAPVGQSARFDAAGYIREWVPELARLPDAAIHAPWQAAPEVLAGAGVTLGTTYPHSIVGHDEARSRALAAYAAIKGEA